MSGYWPTILELTPLAPPWTDSLVPLIGFLEKEHLAHFRRSKEAHHGSFSRDCSELVLGGTEVWSEICISPSHREPQERRVAIALDSKAYEMAYGVIDQRINRDGRQALMRFCARAAFFARPEGFRLRFEKTSVPPLDIDELVKGLTTVASHASAGLIAGISVWSASWPQVRHYWPDWEELEGYQVKEFLG
jgi:hypothetical protein